ncbi:MAG: phospholipase D-like domain-containing protein [Clostridia bacterium]|nr:phospholipase D-like domain-containing protein [Clostridia bacterium]
MEIKNNKTLKRQKNAHERMSPDRDIVRIKTEHRGIGKIKVALMLFVAVLWVVAILCLNVWFANILNAYLIIALVLDLLTCIYILNTDKTGQSKAVWIFLVLILFPFGYMLYFLSNDEFVYRSARKKYGKIFKASEQFMHDGSPAAGASGGVISDCDYLKKAGGVTPFTGTSAKYFPSGASGFDDMLERCSQAKKFIFIEYYIVADGVLLSRFLNVLEERAAAGVDVRIIRDDMGSGGKVSRKTKKRIAAAGIKMSTFNKLVPFYKISMNYRDHRKITVIDGETAYTGGINISDEYINEKRMYGYWKDNAVRIDGLAVDGFTLMFLRQWEYVTKKSFDYSPFLNLAKDSGGTSTFLPYSAGIEYEGWIARDVYANVISNAKEKLYIMTPYFVPDDTIMNLLIVKAMAGVDVRLVLPGIPDKRTVYLISLRNADKLTKYGVKVITAPEAFVHTKSVLTEYCAIIGSINFDVRSFYQQYECALYTDDKAVMEGLAADFNGVFAEGVQREYVQQKPKLSTRVLTALLQVISPLM